MDWKSGANSSIAKFHRRRNWYTSIHFPIPTAARRLGMHLPGVAIASAILAPAVAMLIMVPAIYDRLGENDAAHVLYHVAIALLGMLAGLGAAGLGRVAGRMMALLAIGMALMYAAGVTGG